MARHTGHGVFVGLVGSLSGEDVHLRIVCHHALVHAVEGQLLAVGTPEESAVDAELIAVDSLTIDDFAGAVGSQLCLLLTIEYVELLVCLLIGQGPRSTAPFADGGLLCRLSPLHLPGLEVVEQLLLPVGQQHEWLVRVGVGGIHRRVEVCAHVLQAEQCLPVAFGIDAATLFRILIHQLVAPPREPQVPGQHLPVVGAAEIQVFEGEQSVLCNHRRRS